MLTAGELAGLVVAIFWAILVCFMAVVLVRLARLLTETTKSVAELSDRIAPLLDDMNQTVAEANRRLVAVEAITDNVRDVSGNMVKITGVASTLFAVPMIKVAALGQGFRLAVARRERRGSGRWAGGLRAGRSAGPRIGDRHVPGRGGKNRRSAAPAVEQAGGRRVTGKGRG